MISVSIWRKTLEAQGACAEGLALFDAIAVQQPRTDPRRLRRIRIPRWTALHWIMLVQAGFGEWCATRGIVPRANLYGASLRGANLYDLLRAGYVPLAAQPDPGTLQHLRADLRDAVKERDEAESHAEMRARILTVRAEKAERERDEARRLHSDAEAQVACRNELRAQVAAAEGRFRAAEAERDTLRAELARLAAPGEDGGPWRAYGEPTDQELVDAFEHAYSNAPSVRTHATAIRTIYRLGVAHERARQQPEKGRATDEELVDLYRKIYETHGGLTIDVSHGDCRRAAVLAVAAHVRKERCLVAQAVGMGAGVTISRMSERVPGTTGMWDVYVTRRPDVPGEHYAYGVPVADVPATLARLLGEVSRG